MKYVYIHIKHAANRYDQDTGESNLKWHVLDVEQIEQKLHVSKNKGLYKKQIEQRRKQYGLNEMVSEKKPSKIFLFLKQFQDFMVLLLLAATLVAGLLGEYIDAIAIMVIVFINGFIGYFQERKAEKSLDKLKELAAPHAVVLREGKWKEVGSKELVIGDVVKLNTGDRMMADMRLVTNNALEMEESALTGESLPISKEIKASKDSDLEAQNQKNMVFMGTTVTKGNGVGIVVGTGMQTVMGQIASLMSKAAKQKTPLEYRLQQLGKILITIALLLTALVVVLGIIEGHPIYQMFLAGVSLAVAAIPEGLPAIVTVALSLGVQRMIRKKAIVRELSAVETLGCASVICSDKTGTMTENKMTVKKVWLQNKFIDVTGEGYDTEGQFLLNERKNADLSYALEDMLLYGMLCNDAALNVKKGEYIVKGDPTDGALLIAARKFGLSYQQEKDYQIEKILPFDSNRKRMSMIIRKDNGQRLLISKGAPEVMLPRCRFQNTHLGKEVLYHKDHMMKAVDELAEEAYRTIAIAVRPLDETASLNEEMLESNLTFIGLYGIVDPPRKEVKQSIQECREAGIKTVMITGDHKVTAEAIADEINLRPKDGLVLTGQELNRMSEDELSEIIDQVYVFARVSPEHKLKIIHAFQKRGHIVAMTGDGVNDAPAIKASDIGISMGVTGTDVTKEASSLILMDDNFSTIRAAIEEGRNIYSNIRKFIRYLLASNVGEILAMLFAIMLSLPLPLVPVQILWVNLVTDGLPAIALGLDNPEEEVMKRPPRNPRESVLAKGLGFKILTRGFMIGLVTLIAFWIVYQNNPENLTYARTIAFTTLVIAQLIHVFDCRSESSIFSRNPFENLYLVAAVIVSLLMVIVVIYWDPLQPIFHTVDLNLNDWLFVCGLAAIPTVLFGFSKRI